MKQGELFWCNVCNFRLEAKNHRLSPHLVNCPGCARDVFLVTVHEHVAGMPAKEIEVHVVVGESAAVELARHFLARDQAERALKPRNEAKWGGLGVTVVRRGAL